MDRDKKRVIEIPATSLNVGDVSTSINSALKSDVDLVFLKLSSNAFPNRIQDLPDNLRRILLTNPRVKAIWDNEEIDLGECDIVQDPVGEVKDKVVVSKPKSKIVVTMTSWTKRIQNCLTVIESILNNTVKPDILFLNLSIEEFPNLYDDLPRDLVNLCQTNPIVKLNWVPGPNTKSMKKVFPILKYVGDDDVIITVDDDMVIPNDFIQSRYSDFKNNDSCCVITGGGRLDTRIGELYITSGTLFPKRVFDHWDKIVDDEILQTYNDDRTYLYLALVNGVNIRPCTQNTVFKSLNQLYKISLLNCDTHSENSMTKTHSFMFADRYDELIRKRLKQIDLWERIKKNNLVDICYITDRNYMKLTAVSISSILKNKDPHTKYRIHIICDELNQKEMNLLSQLQTPEVQVETIRVNVNDYIGRQSLTKRNDGIKRISNSALLKFFIPTILGTLEKVVYLDGDVVMKRDILDMYNMNFNGKYLCAVPDELSFDFKRWMNKSEKNEFKEFYEKILSSNGAYFNTGVMLLNLKKMREDNAVQKCLDFKMNNRTWFVDQDVFNYVYGSNYINLDINYNMNKKYLQSKALNDIISIRYGRPIDDHAVYLFHVAGGQNLDEKMKIMQNAK